MLCVELKLSKGDTDFDNWKLAEAILMHRFFVDPTDPTDPVFSSSLNAGKITLFCMKENVHFPHN